MNSHRRTPEAEHDLSAALAAWPAGSLEPRVSQQGPPSPEPLERVYHGGCSLRKSIPRVVHLVTEPTRALQLELEGDTDVDAAEVDALTTGLRREPLELDVSAVDRPKAGEMPAGARGAEAVAVGALLVTLAKPEVLGALVATVRSWIARSAGRSVRLTLEGDTLVLTDISSEVQERLVEEWLSRHTQN